MRHCLQAFYVCAKQHVDGGLPSVSLMRQVLEQHLQGFGEAGAGHEGKC